MTGRLKNFYLTPTTSYESDKHVGMDVREIAKQIYEYTSGYPYLVSYICKVLDEGLAGQGITFGLKTAVSEAAKYILSHNNTVFDDMTKKITDYPELKRMLYEILFEGQGFPYNPGNQIVQIGERFGFISNKKEQAVISNRIFETWFYNLFISEEALQSKSYKAAAEIKNQFIHGGCLDMRRVLVKFMEHFAEIYGDCPDSFKEENGRRLFLLYLKPIINGTGNSNKSKRQGSKTTECMGKTIFEVVV